MLAHTDYRLIPILSLLCNLLVVSIGSWRFGRAGAVEWRRCWPLFITSVPFAWLGGRMPVSQTLFVGLLAASLIVAGLTMLVQPQPAAEKPSAPTAPISWHEPTIGATLGLLAGITGIGGGIFLAPVLHLLRWGRPRAIAGTCALFIFVNSISGLLGQTAKNGPAALVDQIGGHWLLFPAVALGGIAGSMTGSTRLKPRHLAVLTAILVLAVGGQLAVRLVRMLSSGAT